MNKPWVPLGVSFVTLAIIGVFATKHCMQKGRQQREAAAQRTIHTRARARVRLDVARFREELQRRRDKVKALATHTPKSPYQPPRTGGSSLGDVLTAPQCILGPGDLCASITELIAACDAKDAGSCLAIAQFLQETTPRPLAAVTFIYMTCEQGDKQACDRLAEIKTPPTKACAEDPFWCAFYANLTSDEVMLDEACVAGVADACAILAGRVADEPALEQRYLAESCQLGNPMACTALGERLDPGCKESCYPPDPEQAAAANAIGCAAGFEQACK